MTGDELESIVMKMLGEGVPAGVVARVFDLDHELIKEAQKTVRVQRYGTDDMTEYMEQLQWDAVDEARRIIESGSAADKSRMLGMVLGKQVALSARRTPESVRNSQNSVIELMESMRGGKAKKQPPKSKFIARLSDGAESEGA
jgi:hypothetical protein